MQPTDDSVLLRQYVENHSDEAFAALVTRHINLVYSVARRCVGNPHQAEEVAQAGFILLAKKAAQLRHDKALSSWLFQTTRLTASNFARGESRRHPREQEAHMQSVLNEPGSDIWPKIAPLLDDAVAGLSEKDRRAIVLRFYENRNLREVGAALGASEDAAEKRVNRAVEKLRTFFAKHGVSLGASRLVGVISANAVQSAPAGLAITISSAAAALAGTTICTTATITAAKTIAMTTLQKTLIIATLAAAVGTPLYMQHCAIQTLRAENGRARELAAAASPDESQRSVPQAADAAELERLRREHNELLRLRGEVSRLRQQLTEATPNRPALAAQPAPAPEAEQPPEPVQIFVANADANVPAGQTLAFGGWSTSPGQRTLVFVQPKILERSSPDRVGEVFLQGSFIEVSEEVLAKVAADLNLDVLANLKATGRASSTQGVLTAEQASLVLQTLEQSAGVNVFTTPRISTGDGRQAEVSLTQQTIVAGHEQTLGPSLDVEPRIAPDGSSVNLTVSARLRQANRTQQNAP